MKRVSSTLIASLLTMIGGAGAIAQPASPATPPPSQTQSPAHTFSIGPTDFMLDGRPFLIRSGEMHAARIPRDYWRHRLQMARAMGCNSVCAYLFWNQHEPREGQFDFTGQADVAEYCRIAQEVGLWVILRPGPYSCAEWEFGGFPWWLLKNPDLKLRTRDPAYLTALNRYVSKVGEQLAPLQIDHGGPIIMVQVENEYGSYGNDKEYIGLLRDELRHVGFTVPLFTCDGPSQLPNDTRPDIFCVVNFGGDPEGCFKALRAIRPEGPLMCGEFYPGWFDSWGSPHHRGSVEGVVRDLRYMLENNQSFSIYMVHGGTSFGYSAGANAPPFRPQSTSYDYDAPIDEAGRRTPKFDAIRDLFSAHLQQGESLPDAPAANPIISFPRVQLKSAATLWDNLPSPVHSDQPRTMELLDQAGGCILYRATLPAGPAGTLVVRDPHDIAQVRIDGTLVGVLDRRYNKASLAIPARDKPARLDIFVEAMGRVNYGGQIHDRKGITSKVELISSGSASELHGWDMYSLPLDEACVNALEYTPTSTAISAPAVYRGNFELSEIGDTFLDMRTWARGAVWINGHAIGRYWNIGPQQTLYVPGCWLRKGDNEIIVLDTIGSPADASVEGLAAPILDQVQPDPLAPTGHRKPGQTLKLDGLKPLAEGEFPRGKEWQVARFAPTQARYVCVEALNSNKPDEFTTLAELEVLDANGKPLPRGGWSVVYADSEELGAEEGASDNVLDSNPGTFWHTQWQDAKPRHPHAIVIDLGKPADLSGVRCLPRQDSPNGRIGKYRVFASNSPFLGL